MKHSTFYKDKNNKLQVYATIKHTEHHKFLKSEFNGKAYCHDDGAALYFVPGFPLDCPVGRTVIELN